VEIGSLPESETRLGYKLSLSTLTDDQGTFQIKRVAPGQVRTMDLTIDPNAL